MKKKQGGGDDRPKWSDPIPTKLEPTDFDWLELLCKRSGLKRSNIIRRALRILAAEAKKRPEWNWVQETAEPLPPLPKELKAEVDGGGATTPSFSAMNAKAHAAAEAQRKEIRLKNDRERQALLAKAKRLEAEAARAEAAALAPEEER